MPLDSSLYKSKKKKKNAETGEIKSTILGGRFNSR